MGKTVEEKKEEKSKNKKLNVKVPIHKLESNLRKLLSKERRVSFKAPIYCAKGVDTVLKLLFEDLSKFAKSKDDKNHQINDQMIATVLANKDSKYYGILQKDVGGIFVSNKNF
jgi:hypothetical protein